MTTGWKTTQMEKRQGPYVLVVLQTYAGYWGVHALLNEGWYNVGVVVHPSASYETAIDAIDAAEVYVHGLGPVEPVLALLGAFDCRGHERRARKVAA